MVLQILLCGVHRNEDAEEKRGFKLQREAKEWERNFLERQQADLTMKFENFVQLYEEDIKNRVKEVTYQQKEIIIQKKLLPYFGKLPVSEITPAVVRKWQNELNTYRDENGKPFSETYLKNIHNHLTAIFNNAEKIL